MKAFWGMVVMVVGLGCMVFTGGCSLMLLNAGDGILPMVMFFGFLPFFLSSLLFLKGFSILRNDDVQQYSSHQGLAKELSQKLARPYKAQPDEQAEKIDIDSDFFNEP